MACYFLIHPELQYALDLMLENSAPEWVKPFEDRLRPDEKAMHGCDCHPCHPSEKHAIEAMQLLTELDRSHAATEGHSSEFAMWGKAIQSIINRRGCLIQTEYLMEELQEECLTHVLVQAIEPKPSGKFERLDMILPDQRSQHNERHKPMAHR